MKQELQEELYNKYPKIFAQKDLTIYESCMPWGICCGNGWYFLIDTLCGQIQHHLKQLQERHNWEVRRYENLSWWKKL